MHGFKKLTVFRKFKVNQVQCMLVSFSYTEIKEKALKIGKSGINWEDSFVDKMYECKDKC